MHKYTNLKSCPSVYLVFSLTIIINNDIVYQLGTRPIIVLNDHVHVLSCLDIEIGNTIYYACKNKLFGNHVVFTNTSLR